VARSLYVKELAERIGIEETAVLEKIREASAADTAQGQPAIDLSKSKTKDAGSVNIAKQKLQGEIADRMERQIIIMLLQFPDIIPEVNNYNIIEYFENNVYKEIASGILKYEQISDNHRDTLAGAIGGKVRGRVSEIMTFINDKKQERIIAELASSEDTWDIQGCRKLIHQFIDASRGRRPNNSIEKRIRQAELNGDQKLLAKLLSEKQQIAISKQRQKMSLLQRK
jgi:DNA primase